MNPDEVERHIMNGSRATKIAFDLALDETPTREVRVVGGCWQQVNPGTNLAALGSEAPVTVGNVGDDWFELEFTIGSQNRSLNLPFGVVEQAWVGADRRLHIILSVRVVYVVFSDELTVQPQD